MIFKAKNQQAAAGSILVMGDGAGLCCGDEARMDYATAEFDATTEDIETVNITVPGGSAEDITLANAADLSDSANWPQFIEDMGKAATDKGFHWMDGGISVEDGPTANNVIVKVLDSTLIFNSVKGSTGTHTFTASNPVG